MFVSLFLPMHASVDRGVCVWTGGAPTSAVSHFLQAVFEFTCCRRHILTPQTECKPKLFLDLYVIALQCPSSMEYDACRTGCIDDCGSLQTLRGDGAVAKGNQLSCMDTPTEGCFCNRGTVLHHGRCVSPEACQQCVDHQGRTYAVRHTETPERELNMQNVN